MPLNKRAIFCIKKFRRNVPRAARWELTYTSWKCLQQNTTAEPVGKGALLSTNGEGCKYENKSPVQSDEAQSPHGHPSSRIWTWISTTGWGPRSLLDSSSSPLVFAATLGAARLADRALLLVSIPQRGRARPAPPWGWGTCSHLPPPLKGNRNQLDCLHIAPIRVKQVL